MRRGPVASRGRAHLTEAPLRRGFRKISVGAPSRRRVFVNQIRHRRKLRTVACAPEGQDRDQAQKGPSPFHWARGLCEASLRRLGELTNRPGMRLTKVLRIGRTLAAYSRCGSENASPRVLIPMAGVFGRDGPQSKW